MMIDLATRIVVEAVTRPLVNSLIERYVKKSQDDLIQVQVGDVAPVASDSASAEVLAREETDEGNKEEEELVVTRNPTREEILASVRSSIPDETRQPRRLESPSEPSLTARRSGRAPKSEAIELPVNVSPSFKLVFLSVLALTIASGAVAASIAFFGHDPLSSQQASVLKTFSTVFVAGTGAIFGLLGGKSV